MKYKKETIRNACEMLKSGMSIRKIMKETGIKSHIVIYWHCDPVQRKKQEDRINKWITENREKWLKMCKKASKNYQKRHGKKHTKTN